MANGYVPRFMRPPPGQRLPYVRPLQNLHPQPHNDPNLIFERPKPAFCAFPDDGPNIFQQAFTSFKLAISQQLVAVLTALQDVGCGNLRRDVLTEALWENSWSIFIGLACVVVMSLLAWFFAPKGENQTYAPFPPCRHENNTLDSVAASAHATRHGCSVGKALQ